MNWRIYAIECATVAVYIFQILFQNIILKCHVNSPPIQSTKQSNSGSLDRTYSAAIENHAWSEAE